MVNEFLNKIFDRSASVMAKRTHPIISYQGPQKRHRTPSFFLQDSVPLINLVFLLFLEVEDQKDLVEQKIKLMTWTRSEFLKKNFEVIKKFPRCLAFMEKAANAVKAGEIGLGEKALTTKILDFKFIEVDTISFLLWADKQNIHLDEDIIRSTECLYEQRYIQQRNREELEENFPRLRDEEFTHLQKEPLWTLADAIIYLMGRKSDTNKEESANFINNDPKAMKLMKYITDALDTGDLKPFKSQIDLEKDKRIDQYGISSAEFKPRELIEWLKTLPIDLPMLAIDQTAEIQTHQQTSYKTVEMEIMEEVVQKFWANYDLNRDDSSMAHSKKEVVDFIFERAEAKKIKISQTLAKQMDTIIRSPNSRKGGKIRS